MVHLLTRHRLQQVWKLDSRWRERARVAPFSEKPRRQRQRKRSRYVKGGGTAHYDTLSRKIIYFTSSYFYNFYFCPITAVSEKETVERRDSCYGRTGGWQSVSGEREYTIIMYCTYVHKQKNLLFSPSSIMLLFPSTYPMHLTGEIQEPESSTSPLL